MAKKEFIKLTPEGLNLLTVLDYSRIADINGFSQKEVFFTEGFSGNKSLLYQALGNLGAFCRDYDFDKDISLVVISNSLLNSFEKNPDAPSFLKKLEEYLNKNNSPYRRMRFISEDQLIWYIENRVKQTNDDLTKSLVQKYKASSKELGENMLF